MPDSCTRAVLLATFVVVVLAGCGREPGYLTGTAIPQPTPDRTVDAIVKGLVPPVVAASPGATSALPTAAVASNQSAVGRPATPAPTSALRIAPAPTAAVQERALASTVGPTAPRPTATTPPVALAAPAAPTTRPPTAVPTTAAPATALPATAVPATAVPGAAPPGPTAGPPRPAATPTRPAR